MNWQKLDPKNLPKYGRMLVCNAVEAWAVDMVHASTDADDWRGSVFAYSDSNQVLCCLTHYAEIRMPPPPAPKEGE